MCATTMQDKMLALFGALRYHGNHGYCMIKARAVNAGATWPAANGQPLMQPRIMHTYTDLCCLDSSSTSPCSGERGECAPL